MGENGAETCCCGIGLQKGSRLIAIIDILVAFLTLFSLLFFQQVTELLEKYFGDLDSDYLNIKKEDGFYTEFLSVFNSSTDGQSDTNNDFEIDAVVFLSLVILFTTLDICVSAILLHASNTKSKWACCWWFRFRVFLLMSFIVYFFVVMGKSRLFCYGLVDILLIFYRVYCLCIVDSFMKEIERETIRNNRRRISIVVPHVQVITPDGSFSAPFPVSPSGGQHFFTPPPLGSSRIIQQENDSTSGNGFNYSRLD